MRAQVGYLEEKRIGYLAHAQGFKKLNESQVLCTTCRTVVAFIDLVT